jgi:hypothetical protein
LPPRTKEEVKKVRMPQRDTQFEVVPLSKVPALAAASQSTSPRPQVLSISYDESLARTRELILDAAGIDVHTALDIQKAMWLFGKNRFDLVILGHSIPLNERQLIAERLRSVSSTPILAISRAGERSTVPAEHHVNASDGPRRLLNVVRKILNIAEPATAALNESESGDEVLMSGLYQLEHAAGHVPAESVFIKGELFPECSRCAEAIHFKLLMGAPSLEQDPDFRHVRQPLRSRKRQARRRKTGKPRL